MSSSFHLKKFNGKIIRRESGKIYVNIYPGWECSSTGSYSIKFEVNRTGFQLQHNALDFIQMHGLFSIFINNRLYYSQNPISPSIDNNHTISTQNDLNDEQTQAIECIVNGNYNPLPYLLYGPPGIAFLNILF